MTYDAADGEVLLFGGLVSASQPYYDNQTWTFRAGAWTNITDQVGLAPAPRVGMEMTYDAADGYVLAFGGSSNGFCESPFPSCNDTWEFHAGHWTLLPIRHTPPPSTDEPMVFDVADSYVVLFAGEYDQTWTFASNAWTELGAANFTQPPPGQLMAGAYDAGDGYLVVFDGESECSPPPHSCGETWRFSNGNWTQLATVSSPGPRFGASMVYTPSDHSVLLYGGFNTSASNFTPYDDTWSLRNGTWTELVVYSPPGARAEAGFAFDQVDNLSVLFGGTHCNCNSWLNDTWVWSANPLISNVTIVTTPSKTDVGVPVQFSERVFGGYPPYSYSWNFGDGSVSGVPNPSHSFAEVGNYSVSLAVSDGGGMFVRASEQVPVAGPLTVQPTSSPNPTDVGVVTRFSVGTLGGSPPFKYTWLFGDGSSGSLDQPTHIYSTKGNVTVSVWVNDSAGFSATQNFRERVNSAPAVSSLTSSPDPAVLGLPVDFSTKISGGTLTYSYTWVFGDGGLGGNLGNITHIYTTNGPFIATVTVVDGAGRVTSASIGVTIGLTVRIDFSTSVGSAPLTVSFESSVTGGQPGYAYSWAFGDGGTSASAATNHTYRSPGTYAVELRVNDSGGHAARAYASVTTLAATGGGGLSSELLGLPADYGYYLLAVSVMVLAVAAGIVVKRRLDGGGGSASDPLDSQSPYSEYFLVPSSKPPKPEVNLTSPLAETKPDESAGSTAESDPLGDLF